MSPSMEILHLIFTEIEGKLFLFTPLFGEEKKFGNRVMRLTKFVTNRARFGGTETCELCCLTQRCGENLLLGSATNCTSEAKTKSHVCFLQKQKWHSTGRELF